MSAWAKKTAKAGPPQEDWLTTYADAITLLMAFFVMMFSMSELKQDRFAEFGPILHIVGFASAMGQGAGNDFAVPIQHSRVA